MTVAATLWQAAGATVAKLVTFGRITFTVAVLVLEQLPSVVVAVYVAVEAGNAYTVFSGLPAV